MPARLARSRRARASRGPRVHRRLQWELLESRLLLDAVPAFSSLPGANHTIYLDFDGQTVQGTNWNSFYNQATLNANPYDIDGSPATFSATELARIEEAWKRVAEDFSPFNVNVTTVDPGVEALRRVGGSDTQWGIRVIMTNESTMVTNPSERTGSGGIAYINSFTWSSDTPVWVFTTGGKSVAEAASHEVGHSLGLDHDGTASSEYYGGHGGGVTGWAPIMGVGYNQNVTQWDNGAYAGTNNGGTGANFGRGPDDLAIITTGNGFTYRTDDHGNAAAAATNFQINGASVTAAGIIERTTDVDVFTFTTGGGAFTLDIDPFSPGPNLDIKADLYNSSGTLVASSNLSTVLDANFSLNLSAGQYFVHIDGTGSGNYSEYASLGQYFISGTISNPVGPTPQLWIDDVTVSEAAGTATFTVSLTGTITAPVSVNYATTNGTASAGSDYTATSGSLAFTPGGPTTRQVVVSLPNDTAEEGSEQLFVDLSSASGATLGDSRGIGTIMDDDTQVTILDNGSAGFATSGQWFPWNAGYQGDLTYAGSGSGSSVATWTFSGLAPGQYRVSATWLAASTSATNAPFTVLDGSTQVGSATANQQQAPSGFSDAGGAWQDLGGPYTINSGTLVVRLTNAANAAVVADAIRIERISAPTPAPEIQVLENGTNIPDNGAFNFGTTPPGAPVTKNFTVTNVGNQTLTLNTPISVPAGFTLATTFGSTSLAAGASTTFQVRLDATAAGNFSGQVSFGNNDGDENPFNFTISGTVAAAQQVTFIDNGSAGFATSGQWFPWNAGYQGDLTYAGSGSGESVASWTFSGLAPGQYRVSATWLPASTSATNAPFTVLDGSAQVGALTVNQQPAPNGFSDAGGAWQDLGGPYTINSGTLVVRLTNAANAAVVADAIRIELVTPAQPAPEIQVQESGSNITDNTGSVGFGATPPGTPVIKTFTVTNIGNQTLTLNTPITVPAGFSLANSFGTTSLAAGASTTFQVRLDAATAGSFSGQVSFGNNDGDENPFNFAISGTVAATPTVTIIDDGSAGFATTGTWFTWNAGYQGDLVYAGSGSGESAGTWTFSGLAPGQYRVSATWLAASTSATNAPFTVLDGSTQVGTVSVNQQPAPSGFSDAGGTWQDLGGPYTINSGTLVVRLTNAANSAVVADAIRIERLSQSAPEPIVDPLWYFEPVAEHDGHTTQIRNELHHVDSLPNDADAAASVFAAMGDGRLQASARGFNRLTADARVSPASPSARPRLDSMLTVSSRLNAQNWHASGESSGRAPATPEEALPCELVDRVLAHFDDWFAQAMGQ